MSPGSRFQDSWVEQIWEHNESVLNFIIFSTLLSQSCEKSYMHCYYIYIVRFLNYELHYPCGNEGYFLFIPVFFFGKGRVKTIWLYSELVTLRLHTVNCVHYITIYRGRKKFYKTVTSKTPILFQLFFHKYDISF